MAAGDTAYRTVFDICFYVGCVVMGWWCGQALHDTTTALNEFFKEKE